MPEGALGPWYGNTLNMGALRFLHYLSSQALLSVVIELKDRRSAEQRFAQSLARLLHSLGSPEPSVLREIELLRTIQYGRASNRSILGSMRDQAYLASYRLEEGRVSLDRVNLDLAETPCGPLAYASPRRVTAQLLSLR